MVGGGEQQNGGFVLGYNTIWIHSLAQRDHFPCVAEKVPGCLAIDFLCRRIHRF